MNKLTKLAVCLALSLTGAVFVSPAAAGTATASILVTVTLLDSCTVKSMPLVFGKFNSTPAATLDAVATISPMCTRATSYTAALNVGHGAGATLTYRKLVGPDGAGLTYGIFTDATRTTLWGEASSGTTRSTAAGSGVARPVVLYARVPAAQGAWVGSYADAMTLTLTY